MLMIFDILKEAIETFGFGKLYFICYLALVGFLMFKLLDRFVPDHHHPLYITNKEKKKHHLGILFL